MKRRAHSDKKQSTHEQDDVFCAKTGARISSAVPSNIIAFPSPVTNSGAVAWKLVKSEMIASDDI